MEKEKQMGKIIEEEAKLLHDYLKHLATLSTGSVVLLITFLEKLFLHPEWKWMMAVSLSGFVFSIVSNIVAQTGNLETMHYTADEQRKSGWFLFQAFGMFGTWIGFLVGIVALVMFALKNMI